MFLWVHNTTQQQGTAMEYIVEVIVRVIGPDGVPVDSRGRPCDETDTQIQATRHLSTHRSLDAALLAFEGMLEDLEGPV